MSRPQSPIRHPQSATSDIDLHRIHLRNSPETHISLSRIDVFNLHIHPFAGLDATRIAAITIIGDMPIVQGLQREIVASLFSETTTSRANRHLHQW